MKGVLVALCIVFIASGCSLFLRDVSNEDEYRNVVGREFRTREEFFIYGYTKDHNYETIDGYVMINIGIAGREILTKDRFPVGSIILVKSVADCRYCSFLGKQIFIEIVSEESYRGSSVKLRDTGDILVYRSNGSVVDMNPQLFELIED